MAAGIFFSGWGLRGMKAHQQNDKQPHNWHSAPGFKTYTETSVLQKVIPFQKN